MRMAKEAPIANEMLVVGLSFMIGATTYVAGMFVLGPIEIRDNVLQNSLPAFALCVGATGGVGIFLWPSYFENVEAY